MPPASSSPPGRPRRRSSSASSRPLVPTSASGGTPSASSAARRAAGMAPTSPTTASNASPSGRLRPPDSPSGGLCAITLPSLARSVARRGSVVLRVRLAPAGTPGKATDGDHSTRCEPSIETIVEPHRQRQRPPHPRLDPYWYLDVSVAHRTGAPGGHLGGRGRGLQGVPVRRRERAGRGLAPGRGRDVAVHLGVVAAGPCAHIAFGERHRRGGAAVRADDRAGDERDRGEGQHGPRSAQAVLAAIGQGVCRTWRGDRAGLANCRVRSGPRRSRLPSGLHRRRRLVRGLRRAGRSSAHAWARCCCPRGPPPPTPRRSGSWARCSAGRSSRRASRASASVCAER